MDNAYDIGYIPPRLRGARRHCNPLQLELDLEPAPQGVFSGKGQTSRRVSGVIKCRPPKTHLDNALSGAAKATEGDQ